MGTGEECRLVPVAAIAELVDALDAEPADALAALVAAETAEPEDVLTDRSPAG